MVELQDQDVVAVLTRAPSSGGKTRLFADLACPPDPDLLTALLLDTLEAAASPGVVRAVCFTPAAAEPELRRSVPAEVVLVPQRGQDLGERMRRAFDDLFARGARSVVLVGSDIPGLDPDAIATTVGMLRTQPAAVVLGPAQDGGYYLVGATSTPHALLSGMSWSRADVLDETYRRAEVAGIEILRVRDSLDIDTLRDLDALLAGTAPAVRTRAWCRTHYPKR